MPSSSPSADVLKFAPPAPPRDGYATIDGVANQVDNWSVAFLRCRSYSHSWKPQRATWEEDNTVVHAVLLCTSCKTKKHFELTYRGYVIRKWYEYADGYLSTGLGRIVGDAKDFLRFRGLVREFDLEAPPKRNRKAS